MRFKPLTLGLTVTALLLILGGWHLISAQSGPPEGGGAGPVVFFPEKAFEFQPVIEGAAVVHDFVVMNKGTLPLLITNVRTG